MIEAELEAPEELFPLPKLPSWSQMLDHLTGTAPITFRWWIGPRNQSLRRDSAAACRAVLAGISESAERPVSA